jgi:hypothetical protein
MPKGIKFTSLESRKLQIESLNETNQKMILKILKDDNIIVMENADGIFFDIVGLPKHTLQTIISYIDFCEKSREDIEKRQRNEDIFRKELKQTSTTNDTSNQLESGESDSDSETEEI